MPEKKLRVLLVASHPVQYAAPQFRRLAQDPRLDLRVAFCSMQGVEGGLDQEFGIEVKWDVPLLNGYSWVQIPNHSPRPGVGRFFGLINPGLWSFIRKNRFDAVIVHTGYLHFSYWILLAAARTVRTPLVFATDAWSLPPRDAKPWKRWIKPFVVPRIYRLNEIVAVASSAGKDFIRSLGIPEERVVLVPNVLDNDWWKEQAARVDRSAVRAGWGISDTAAVVLSCAKLQPWKRPHDLLQAFAKADVADSFLVYAGAGPLSAELVAEAARLGISARTRFLGFVNQSSLPGVYRAADVMVLPSEHEPFGFVVNEAMVCGCAVVTSDRVGAARDLVRHAQNGFTYRCGDVEALAGILRNLLSDRGRLRAMGAAARERMETWSLRESIQAMVEAIRDAAAMKRK